MKRLNKKGFTMAELLIVVAIIAVLVAIAIPIFTAQLEKSRDAVSVSNIRAAYAEASSAYLSATKSETIGNVVVDTTAKTAVVDKVQFKGTMDGWSGLESQLDGFNHDAMTDALGADAGEHKLTFTFTDAGSCTLTID